MLKMLPWPFTALNQPLTTETTTDEEEDLGKEDEALCLSVCLSLTAVVNVVTIVLYVAYSVACRLAGTNCKRNRQLPKILILV